MTLGFDLLMQIYYNIADPVIVRLRKKERLKNWERLETIYLNLNASLATDMDATNALQRFRRIAQRYDMYYCDKNEDRSKRRATPMLFNLSQCNDYEAFEQILRRQSTRTLPKIRKAQRLGYVVKPF